MPQLQQASLSILTWKAPDTLRRTLQSLEPLRGLFSDRLVICQESDPREIDLATQYGYRAIAISNNVGIQEGLALAVEKSAGELVLVLENDCNYIGGESGNAQLEACLTRFRQHNFDVIKLGELPANPREKYMKYWDQTFPPKRTLLGMLRRREANACKAEVIAFPEFEPNAVPEIEKLDDHLFLTRSKHAVWTNRAILVSKDFFLGQLLPFARSNPTARRVNGLPDLEHAINSPKNRNWWRSADFRIGLVKPGLFGHKRYDRPALDEKWDTGGVVSTLISIGSPTEKGLINFPQDSSCRHEPCDT